MPERAALPEVIAVGAWLKNAACRLGEGGVRLSRLHGDLGDPQACADLDASVAALRAASPRPVAAVAHDLHPDFYSTRLAVRLAGELGVPAIGVQHHHAHVAAVMAEHGLHEPVIGLALDGVGLGTDGHAWGGELLAVAPGAWQRLGHLRPLALPGGDVAAREPWRMAASLLHALGRGGEIAPRFAPVVGATAAQGVARMLAQGLNCPPTSSAGRWFDAAAATLGLSVKQAHEAEAAIALERAATRALSAGRLPLVAAPAVPGADSVLDPAPLVASLFDTPPDRIDDGAAIFHAGLADALADWAARAAAVRGIGNVCVGGGCFLNTILTERIAHGLQARGLRVFRPLRHSCGDAGLALGQAWVAAHTIVSQALTESPPCAWPSLLA